MISSVTTRAWRDDNFRTLLFDNPRAALIAEFGSVPAGFENAIFQPREIDRAIIRRSRDGNRILVRPKRGDEPLGVVVRRVFDMLELIVVFYTKRCRYQCSFCTLPLASAYSDVSFDDVKVQLDRAFEFAGADATNIERVSLGNEGSILDERTFPREQLEYVLRRCAGLQAVEEVVLETRGEFVTERAIDDLLEWTAPARLTLKDRAGKRGYRYSQPDPT